MISKKLGTCILAAVAAAVIAAPLFPLSEVKAAEPVNLALKKTATANDTETDNYQMRRNHSSLAGRQIQALKSSLRS